MDDQHAGARVGVFLDRHPAVEPVEKPGGGATRFGESLRAHDLSWSAVGHAKNDLAAALVGQGHTVFDQLLEMKVVGGRLEFELAALGGVKVALKFSGRGGHG